MDDVRACFDDHRRHQTIPELIWLKFVQSYSKTSSSSEKVSIFFIHWLFIIKIFYNYI